MAALTPLAVKQEHPIHDPSPAGTEMCVRAARAPKAANRARGPRLFVLRYSRYKKNLAYMEYQTKFICKIFLWMDVTFRDEFNDDN